MTPFSRSGEGLDLLAKVQLYWWDMEKNWLDFGDPDPIFKVKA